MKSISLKHRFCTHASKGLINQHFSIFIKCFPTKAVNPCWNKQLNHLASCATLQQLPPLQNAIATCQTHGPRSLSCGKAAPSLTWHFCSEPSICHKQEVLTARSEGSSASSLSTDTILSLQLWENRWSFENGEQKQTTNYLAHDCLRIPNPVPFSDSV